jgi:hypothetical protein
MGILTRYGHTLLALLFVLPACATVTPALPFTDNMVLQQKQPVPIWGTAAPGAWQVTMEDGGYTLEAMLPLAYFGIAPQANGFLTDAAVIAAPYAGQKPAMLWCSSPQFAFSHNEAFAQVTLTDAR